MRTRFFLTVNKGGQVRATKRQPDLMAGEVGFGVTIEIPDAAFRQPFAEATIEVPEGYVIKPEIQAWLDPIEQEDS